MNEYVARLESAALYDQGAREELKATYRSVTYRLYLQHSRRPPGVHVH